MRLSYADIGIVVKTQDYKEADKIITMVTKNHGLVHLFATGARRSGSKKSSHLDLLSQVKFSVNQQNQNSFLVQAESVNFFPSIKADLKKISLSVSFAEILLNLLPEEVEDEEVFISLTNFLVSLDQSKSKPRDLELSRQFGAYLIRHLGYPQPPKNSDASLSSYFEVLMNRKIISKEIS